ncbi:DUF885 family protein [Sphingomonas sp. PvP056]|uniref:DUF885 family protein n=1 Tax=Sphingomonas sp. PvP056 TaxID=3156392 RepID=UPI0033961590
MMRHSTRFALLLALLTTTTAVPLQAQEPPARTTATPGRPALVALFTEWRRFADAPRVAGVPDYSPAAMARQAAGLATFRQRLAALDRTGWSKADGIDAQLIEAEMNGLDFNLRVLRPWARDPGFYQTVWGEESDVPAHEGPNAPAIDLFAFDYPLSAKDARQLTTMLQTVPALLTQARGTLAASNARDLWLYGARAFREQSAVLAKLEAGTLTMRTLEGAKHADLSGAGRSALPAVRAARAATDAFAAWIAAEAPKKTGPSGVGKADYDWAMRNVHLLPYGYDEQVALLQRELDRSRASMRLEEVRNRALPPLDPIEDSAAYTKLAAEKARRFADFLITTGMVPDKPYYRAAIAAQQVPFTPLAERNFFSHVTARDPLPLYSHDYHWIDLARLKHEPQADPIRQGPLLYNIWEERSEGFATAMEEIALHTGLYDDLPRGRELVWIMLANRAARGLASLKVQANEMTLAEAGQYHARWTPRGFSDAASDLVGFEQLLYLRQPGYGTSYVTGKLQYDRLLSDLSDRAERDGKPFDAARALQAMWAPGIIPVALIEAEMVEGAR